MEYVFPVNPVPASRPRVGKFGSYFTGTYKSFRSRAAEAVANVLGHGFKPLDGSLRVDIECYVERPKSPTKTYPRGDVDNYAKAVLDSLNGKLWIDDSQITELYVTKTYCSPGDPGYFTVGVSPIESQKANKKSSGSSRSNRRKSKL